MRKLIVEEWISLDGFISDSNGSLSFFINQVRDAYTNGFQVQHLDSVDCILFGRKTYQQFAALWPERPTENDPLAHRINTTEKIVFSDTLKNAPWGKWQSAQVNHHDPVAVIKELKASAGKNMVMWGSVSLAQTLMRENVVDEYRLHICPTLTGGGRKFFTEQAVQETLELREVNRTKAGAVVVTYGVRNN